MTQRIQKKDYYYICARINLLSGRFERARSVFSSKAWKSSVYYSLLLSLSHNSNEREKWEKIDKMKQIEITISFTLIWLLLASSCNYRHFNECRLKASSFVDVCIEYHYEFVTLISNKKWMRNENTSEQSHCWRFKWKKTKNIFTYDSDLLQCPSAATACFCLFHSFNSIFFVC